MFKKLFKNTYQKDNAYLRLEWETQFLGLCMATELKHNRKNLKYKF